MYTKKIDDTQKTVNLMMDHLQCLIQILQEFINQITETKNDVSKLFFYVIFWKRIL